MFVWENSSKRLSRKQGRMASSHELSLSCRQLNGPGACGYAQSIFSLSFLASVVCMSRRTILSQVFSLFVSDMDDKSMAFITTHRHRRRPYLEQKKYPLSCRQLNDFRFPGAFLYTRLMFSRFFLVQRSASMQWCGSGWTARLRPTVVDVLMISRCVSKSSFLLQTILSLSYRIHVSIFH